MKNQSLPVRIAFAVVPILVSLLVTALLIILVGADPTKVVSKLWSGAFADLASISNVINFWIPLTLASIGLVVTFTAGLWNIGVEGQILMGALFASGVALHWQIPAPFLVPVEIMVAMLGGALWALLVGALKVYLGVHEIFGGVALNALANVIAITLITGPWRGTTGGNSRGTPTFPTDAILPPISADLNVSLLAFIIVIVVVVVIWLALRGTRWGLQLKATGKNARSALLLGVPTDRSTLSAFVVCGLIAGIAGSYRVLFTFQNLRPLVSGGIGFLALLVVLLISMRVLWVPIITLIFALLLGGSAKLKIDLKLDASLVGVMQDTIVLIVLLFNGLRQRIQERRQQIDHPKPTSITATVENQRIIGDTTE
ncbi:MAG: ABC transporter permease [Anaerolineaceae bacterium]|nr:ABC transporter permease [Anaerolineaceae bacterium]